VTAAEDGASSSSQKLASKATTTASQMRIPKAQAPMGTPAMLNGRPNVAVVIRCYPLPAGDFRRGYVVLFAARGWWPSRARWPPLS
jgi:hypothetical protein